MRALLEHPCARCTIFTPRSRAGHLDRCFSVRKAPIQTHTNGAGGLCARVCSSVAPFAPNLIPSCLHFAFLIRCSRLRKATFLFFVFRKGWISAIMLYNGGLVVQPRPLPHMALYFDADPRGKAVK
ncbi:hypothetical protein B0H12DRAFT_1135902 [Mycena haematopus]|nr:hypothetical protein B0H12DRAFT_1135902 [Mycena haematopus]